MGKEKMEAGDLLVGEENGFGVGATDRRRSSPPRPPSTSSSSSSSLVFLGTGCSSAVPNAMCLIQPSDPVNPCRVCTQSLSVPPQHNPNYRCNTCLLVDYCGSDGEHSYILIDVGKTFREQVLRWFTHHKIPRVDSIILTHEHADAVLGLDDIRSIQPFSPTNDIDPTSIYLTQFAMDSIAIKFPYLVQKKLKEGQEVRRVAQLDWKIIESSCEKPFTASGLHYIKDRSRTIGSSYLRHSLQGRLAQYSLLPASVKRICPKQALLIGMTHEFDHHKDNELLAGWSKREGIPVQLAHDGLRVIIDL
ncbi:hypothetical protein QJS04_geneDACA022148 [Acorus gramineus]|uniref:Metallo-beta-lactamase domain-containing protein n=1 Tax=Acorus gramineus TaxID=55184 RepID=A0AAV9BPI9_ACOGR|nr:hypothetical protein QJS04_geneDACA022148 [Acorus gramineus]